MYRSAKPKRRGWTRVPAEVQTALQLEEGDAVPSKADAQEHVQRHAERTDSRFARYAGVLHEDRGLDAEGVVADIRDARGW